MEVNYGDVTKSEKAEDEEQQEGTTSSVPLPTSQGVVPRDAEGFHQSFKLNPQAPDYEQVVDQARAFFKQYGFVVFRDAVPEELVEAAIEDIWQNYLPKGIQRKDPSTWFTQSDKNWVSSVFVGQYNTMRGFLGYKIALSQAAWNIRQHPSLYRAFVTVLENEKLKMKLDRYGLMRPTKVRVPKEGGSSGEFEVVDHPEWKTEERWVHWDQNPWYEPEFRGGDVTSLVINHLPTHHSPSVYL